MTDSIQTLSIVDRLFPEVLKGLKTSTIRWRETRVVPGQLRFICDQDPSQTTVVEVWRCTDMPLSDAAEFLGKSHDWPPDVMVSGMREHYPKIELTSTVQVIEFTLVP